MREPSKLADMGHVQIGSNFSNGAYGDGDDILKRNVASLGLVASGNSVLDLWSNVDNNNRFAGADDWSLTQNRCKLPSFDNTLGQSVMTNGGGAAAESGLGGGAALSPSYWGGGDSIKTALPPEFRPGTKWDYSDPSKLTEDPNATPSTLVKSAFLANSKSGGSDFGQSFGMFGSDLKWSGSNANSSAANWSPAPLTVPPPPLPAGGQITSMQQNQSMNMRIKGASFDSGSLQQQQGTAIWGALNSEQGVRWGETPTAAPTPLPDITGISKNDWSRSSINSSFHSQPPFGALDNCCPKFEPVSKLNPLNGVTNWQSDKGPAAGAPPLAPLWGESRNGASWENPGNQVPSRINPIFNPADTMPRSFNQQPLQSAAPPNQSNIWNASTNAQETAIDNSMVWRNPNPKKPPQPDRGTSVWGDPELYSTVEIRRWKTDGDDVVDAQSSVAVAAAAASISYQNSSASSALTSSSSTPAAAGPPLSTPINAPSSQSAATTEASAPPIASPPATSPPAMTSPPLPPDDRSTSSWTAVASDVSAVPSPAATPTSGAQSTAGVNGGRWGTAVSSSNEDTWSPLKPGENRSSNVGDSSSFAFSTSAIDNSSDSVFSTSTTVGGGHSDFGLTSFSRTTATSTHLNNSINQVQSQPVSKFLDNDHITVLTKKIGSQLKLAVERGFIDSSIFQRPLDIDTLQHVNQILECADKLDKCQAELIRLQQQQQQQSCGGAAAVAHGQEFQRLNNEISLLSANIQALKGQICRQGNAPPPSNPINGLDLFQQSKYGWRDEPKREPEKPSIGGDSDSILQRNVASLGLVASNTGMLDIWSTDESVGFGGGASRRFPGVEDWSNKSKLSFENALSHGMSTSGVESAFGGLSLGAGGVARRPSPSQWDQSRGGVAAALSSPGAKMPSGDSSSFLTADQQHFNMSNFGAEFKPNAAFDPMNAFSANRMSRAPVAPVGQQPAMAAGRLGSLGRQPQPGALPGLTPNSRTMPPPVQPQLMQQPWIMLCNLNNQINDVTLRQIINRVGNTSTFISPPGSGYAFFKYRDVPYIKDALQFLQQQLGAYGVKVAPMKDKEVEGYLRSVTAAASNSLAAQQQPQQHHYFGNVPSTPVTSMPGGVGLGGHHYFGGSNLGAPAPDPWANSSGRFNNTANVTTPFDQLNFNNNFMF